MIQIIERELNKEERIKMLQDYDNIFARAGIPQKDYKHYEYAAEIDGKMIGYVRGLTDHLWLFLTDIWVDEDDRRKGIGTDLLKYIESTIKKDGLKHIYLWTYGPINKKFYEKNGYYVFTVFENFYEVEGYDHIGFRKDL